MKVLGNLLWWLFGGLEAAIGYLFRLVTVNELSYNSFVNPSIPAFKLMREYAINSVSAK